MVAVVTTPFGVVTFTVNVPAKLVFVHLDNVGGAVVRSPAAQEASDFMVTGILPNVAEAAEAGQPAEPPAPAEAGRQPVVLGTM